MGILKTQLILKGIVTDQDWSDMKEKIIVDFMRDNHFTELKDAEILRERIQTLDQMNQYIGDYFSKEWVMKNVLRFTDDDIEQMAKQDDEEQPQGDENE
jgi:hypothetical protein